MKFCKEIKKHLNNKTNKRLFPVTKEVNNSSIFLKKYKARQNGQNPLFQGIGNKPKTNQLRIISLKTARALEKSLWNLWHS